MELKPIFEQLNYNVLAEYPPVELVFRANIDVGAKGITSLLGARASVKPSVGEAMEGEATVSGKVTYKIIFIDGEGVVQGADYVADFSDKIVLDGVSSGTGLLTDATVVDVDSSINGDTVEVAALTRITVFGIAAVEEKALTALDGGYVKQRDVDLMRFKAACTTAFEVYGEFDYGAVISKIVYFDSDVCFTEAVAGEDSIVYKGNIVVNVTVREEEGVATKRFDLPFNEEVACTGVNVGDSVIPRGSVKSSKLMLMEEGGTSIIRFDFVVATASPAFSFDLCQIAVDAFSVSKDIDVERSINKFNYGLQCKSSEEKLAGNADLPENADVAEIVTTTCYNIIVTNAIAMAQTVLIEGVVNAIVLYRNSEDGIASTEVELPFSVKVPFEQSESGDMVFVKASATEVGVRLRRERDLEINADMCVNMCLSKSESIGIITEIDVDKEAEEMAAIGIYFGESGEGIWEVAKSLRAAPETIRLLNPNLEEPLKGGERIVVFRAAH